jgi:hypothetical protein
LTERTTPLNTFIARFRSLITGTLSGFDRLVFRGHLLPLLRPNAMFFLLEASGIRLLDYKQYVRTTTERLRQAALAEANALGRPMRYLASSAIDKEKLARRLLAEQPIDQGLICVFTALEPCMTFEYHRSQNRDERGLKLRPGKCLHLYKYFLHPRFGFCNARIETWFPFDVQICLNGREWLAQQFAREGRTDFTKADNCFTWLGDPALAQHRMDAQLTTDWSNALDGFLPTLNPHHQEIFKAQPMDYYWSVYQMEWATDLISNNPAALQTLYPRLVDHATHHFKSPDVLRFLGGKAHGNYTGEITTSFKDRAEGVRVKHWARGNSIKMYDKAGSVLRVETTTAQVNEFKVLRRPHDDPEGELKWRPMRKGVADLHRRAQISQRANDTYLDSLAVIDDTTPCRQLFDAVCRPVTENGRRTRALRLSDPDDLALLQAVARGEFAIAGVRNRDIRRLLHPAPNNATKAQLRQLSAKTSRQLRLLRAHRVIRKIPKTHRYQLTERGKQLTAALFATRAANIKELLPMAA